MEWLSARTRGPQTWSIVRSCPPPEGIASLEAEGLLRRDSAGTCLPGLSAPRVGLSAHGWGAYASIALTAVADLRRATEHTAFLAVRKDDALLIGLRSV